MILEDDEMQDEEPNSEDGLGDDMDDMEVTFSDSDDSSLVSEIDKLLESESGPEHEKAQEEPAAAAVAPEAVAVPVVGSDNDDGEHASGSAAASAADDGADALEKAGLGFVRRAGVCELRFDLGRLGEVRYNVVSEFYRAHCPIHTECFRRRSSLKSDRIHGQGGPIGMLMHWLQTAKQYASKDAHIKAKPGSFDERLAARDKFESFPSALDFTKYERKQFDHEKAKEPLKIT